MSYSLFFIRPLLTLLALLSTSSTYAIYLDSTIFDMEEHQEFIARTMRNDTGHSNLYTISGWKIAKPGDGNEARVAGGEKELLWSPLRFVMQPDGQEFFKLFYRGPKDSVERYYRVVFTETPISVIPWRNEAGKTDVVPVVAMSSLLVVRPRNTQLKFTVDEASGTLRNTGNTYFRVILQRGCNGNDESSTQFYMLPGETWQGPEAKENNKKYIVALGRYHPLGNGCFSSTSSALD